MKKNNILQIFLCLMAVMLLFGCNNYNEINYKKMKCVKSFEEFAYGFPEDISNTLEPTYPTNPWKLVQTIFNDDVYRDLEFKAIRQVSGSSELWISVIGHGIHSIVVYSIEENEFKILPAQIPDTPFHVADLFIDKENVVWGKVEWWKNYSVDVEDIPSLSRFNEETGKFELVWEALSLPMSDRLTETKGGHEYEILDLVTIDKYGVFWIFTQKNGALYKFNPVNNALDKKFELGKETKAKQIIASEGQDEKIYIFKSITDIKMVSGDIIEFNTSTDEISYPNIPEDQTWLGNEIFFDHSNNIWFGPMGWWDTDQVWTKLHPNPDEYFIDLYNHHWSLPRIILEDANGILWFSLSTDWSFGNGIAWYDPITTDGCQITSFRGDMIEDSSETIWLLIEDKLYRLP